jgi:hypothetical protein
MCMPHKKLLFFQGLEINYLMAVNVCAFYFRLFDTGKNTNNLCKYNSNWKPWAGFQLELYLHRLLVFLPVQIIYTGN